MVKLVSLKHQNKIMGPVVFPGHHHAVVLSDVREEYAISCFLCKAVITRGSVYSCPPCEFYSHRDCAEYTVTTGHYHSAPKNHIRLIGRADLLKILHSERLFSPLHDHRFLSFLGKAKVLGACFYCGKDATEKPFYWLSGEDGHQVCHKSCGSIPRQRIWHPMHPKHALCFQNRPSDYDCHACGRLGKGYRYECPNCEFKAHFQCIKLLPTLTTRHHRHPLTLFNSIAQEDEHANGRKCHICDRNGGDKKMYTCIPCGFTIHESCSSLPLEFENYELHDHFLHYLDILIPSSETICNSCSQKIADSRVVYKCRDCPQETAYHVGCVLPLPQTINDDKLHEHQLKLLYVDHLNTRQRSFGSSNEITQSQKMDDISCEEDQPTVLLSTQKSNLSPRCCQCREQISATGHQAIYKCMECPDDGLYHVECTCRPPRSIECEDKHVHPLFLCYVLDSDNEPQCDECNLKIAENQGVYLCRDCPNEFIYHPTCAFIQFQSQKMPGPDPRRLYLDLCKAMASEQESYDSQVLALASQEQLLAELEEKTERLSASLADNKAMTTEKQSYYSPLHALSSGEQLVAEFCGKTETFAASLEDKIDSLKAVKRRIPSSLEEAASLLHERLIQKLEDIQQQPDGVAN